MAAEVRLCVISLSARSPDNSDAAYLEWHALDHLPEQYAIAGVVHGQRWASTRACRAESAARVEPLASTDHVVQYLFADPVDASLDRFFALGAELRHAGRMPRLLPPVELAGYELVACEAAPRALVRAEVLPWRPGRGAYLIIDEAGRGGVPVDGLVDVPGVAGWWRFRGGDFHDRLTDTTGRNLTVCYLDDDPASVAAGIAPRVAVSTAGLLLAAPFECVVPWQWDRSLP